MLLLSLYGRERSRQHTRLGVEGRLRDVNCRCRVISASFGNHILYFGVFGESFVVQNGCCRFRSLFEFDCWCSSGAWGSWSFSLSECPGARLALGRHRGVGYVWARRRKACLLGENWRSTRALRRFTLRMILFASCVNLRGKYPSTWLCREFDWFSATLD